MDYSNWNNYRLISKKHSMQTLIDRTKLDFLDSYCIEIVTDNPLTAEDVFAATFEHKSPAEQILFDIRNWIATMIGLETGDTFRPLITLNTPEKILMEKDDKHLFFFIEITCSISNSGSQIVGLSTGVICHNVFGRFYFFFVKPFHRVLCRKAINKIRRCDTAYNTKQNDSWICQNLYARTRYRFFIYWQSTSYRIQRERVFCRYALL